MAPAAGDPARRPGVDEHPLFAALVFPVTLAAALGAGGLLLGAGVAPPLASLPPIIGSMLFLAVAERLVPFEPRWLESRRDVHVDVGHAVVSGGVVLESVRPLVHAAAIAGAGALARRFGSDLWPHHWPLGAQLVAALLLGELFMYGIHRATHEWEPLWRFHATHHSAPRLYFLNATRFHPVDLLLSYFSWYVPLVLLGVGEPVIALYALFTAVHGMFQHANVPIRLGPLNWVFSMAELHRWHHSRVLAEANSNYGQNLIVWDVVFGTRRLPGGREPPTDTGLTDLPGFPMSYLAQLLSPFRWRHIQARGAALAGAAGAPGDADR